MKTHAHAHPRRPTDVNWTESQRKDEEGVWVGCKASKLKGTEGERDRQKVTEFLLCLRVSVRCWGCVLLTGGEQGIRQTYLRRKMRSL